MNRFAIKGYMGRTPELKEAATGNKYTRFSIAVKGDKGTTWIDVSAVTDVAERFCQEVTKGDEVYVEGEITMFKSKRHNDNYIVSLLARNFNIVGGSRRKTQEKDLWS